MRGRKPDDLTILRNVRPGGGRLKHIHALQSLLATPAHLAAEAREVFELVRDNAPRGLFAQIDRFLLEVFAEHVVLHRRAVRELDTLVFESESTRRVQPLVLVDDSEAKILLQLSEALGVTIAARQRIKLPETSNDDWSTIEPA